MNVLPDKRFVVIGAGNVGGILLTRLVAANVPGGQIAVVDVQLERGLAAAAAFGVRQGSLSERTVIDADVVLLATPPQAVRKVLETIREWLHPEQLVISFATAVPLDRLEALVPAGVAVARIMLNAPSVTGHGMNPVAYGSAVSVASRDVVKQLLAVLGQSFEIRDEQMSACVGLSSAAMRSLLPVLEGMTRAGVAAGLSEREAQRMAAQVMLGTATLVLRSGLPLEKIKALTPLQTVDEAEVANVFYEAAMGATDKTTRLEHRLWGEPA